MTAVTTTSNEQGLAEFNKLKASIDEQIKNLSLIKVIDETSQAVANQQLSKAKQLVKQVTEAHALVKEEALRFCQSADKAKREMITPLDSAMNLTETELLTYNRKVEADKKAEIERLEAEQEVLRKEAEDAKQALITQMQEFEARAFNLINEAINPPQLSSVYTMYIQEFPALYDVAIKERISKLGKAKLDAIQNGSIGNLQIYQDMYCEYTGTRIEIVAPEIAQPKFDAIEIKKSVIEHSAPASNIKKTWTFEIMNLTEVPLEFLMPDESKIKAYIKDNKEKLVDGNIVCGIKFFIESSVKIK